jgi:phosphoribosyl-AMP cyclohydrolase
MNIAVTETDVIMLNMNKFLDDIIWTEDDLIPVIVQDDASSRVLMFAWMNREALELTVKEQRAVFWSRSRKKIWRKGEESGYIQYIKEIRLDCDGDILIIKVEQMGGISCHTGRTSCFYKVLKNDEWISVDPVIKDPKEIYK